eukprot:m.289287 g.289287  ORF g.289287 m.289287 type:complete len:830 (+) comp16224_c0_seq4:328-2817(+)
MPATKPTQRKAKSFDTGENSDDDFQPTVRRDNDRATHRDSSGTARKIRTATSIAENAGMRPVAKPHTQAERAGEAVARVETGESSAMAVDAHLGAAAMADDEPVLVDSPSAVEETRALGAATSTVAQLQAIRPTRPIQRVAPPSGQPATASSAHATAKGSVAPVTDMEVDSPSEDDLIDVDFVSSAKNSPIAHPSPSPKSSAVRTKRPAPAGDEDGHPERRRRLDEPSESTDALDTSHLTSFEDCPKAGLWDGPRPIIGSTDALCNLFGSAAIQYAIGERIAAARRIERYLDEADRSSWRAHRETSPDYVEITLHPPPAKPEARESPRESTRESLPRDAKDSRRPGTPTTKSDYELAVALSRVDTTSRTRSGRQHPATSPGAALSSLDFPPDDAGPAASAAATSSHTGSSNEASSARAEPTSRRGGGKRDLKRPASRGRMPSATPITQIGSDTGGETDEAQVSDSPTCELPSIRRPKRKKAMLAEPQPIQHRRSSRVIDSDDDFDEEYTLSSKGKGKARAKPPPPSTMVQCPICQDTFPEDQIEEHANHCLESGPGGAGGGGSGSGSTRDPGSAHASTAARVQLTLHGSRLENNASAAASSGKAKRKRTAKAQKAASDDDDNWIVDDEEADIEHDMGYRDKGKGKSRGKRSKRAPQPAREAASNEDNWVDATDWNDMSCKVDEADSPYDLLQQHQRRQRQAVSHAPFPEDNDWAIAVQSDDDCLEQCPNPAPPHPKAGRRARNRPTARTTARTTNPLRSGPFSAAPPDPDESFIVEDDEAEDDYDYAGQVKPTFIDSASPLPWFICGVHGCAVVSGWVVGRFLGSVRAL